LNRQRGHWSVAWRHSIAAPQRQHGSAAEAGLDSSLGTAALALGSVTKAGL
jgi:hypothetical protein